MLQSHPNTPHHQGLKNNDGIFMIASTNHLLHLDSGLSSRPSRFDRKYLFSLPSVAERTLYCANQLDKLKLLPTKQPSIEFPQKLTSAIAGITQDFSFAYLKEAFVATLSVIAGHRSERDETGCGGGRHDDDENDNEDRDLDDYELWREIKNQVRLLRLDMDAKYHVQDITDLASQQGPPPLAIATNPLAKTAAAALNIPSRPGLSRVEQNLHNPHNSVDCDGWHAPLMTDEGHFMDSRFDGI